MTHLQIHHDVQIGRFGSFLHAWPALLLVPDLLLITLLPCLIARDAKLLSFIVFMSLSAWHNHADRYVVGWLKLGDLT